MSSKRKVRRDQCVGKVRYTQERAMAEAAKLHHRTWERMNAYMCRWCNSFHVGHTTKAVRQRISARRNGDG